MKAHIAALRTILMTYHTYSPELGYVQGRLVPCEPEVKLLMEQECQIFYPRSMWSLARTKRILSGDSWD
mgnify:CR=1 FL=1|jgi:hypothetical protein